MGGGAPALWALGPGSLLSCLRPHRYVYMDYNATTPPEPEVVQAVTEAMQVAWGNPSSPYPAGNRDLPLLCVLPLSLSRPP